MGVGVGSGERRMLEAAQRAINSPLLDDISLSGATSVLINITGSSSLTMFEIHEASTMIQEEAHEDANVIWGWVANDDMEDDARITVIATGFEEGYISPGVSNTPSLKPSVTRSGRSSSATGGGGGGGDSSTWWKSGKKPAKSKRLTESEYDIPPYHRRNKKF